jgi:hypothetical protein
LLFSPSSSRSAELKELVAKYARTRARQVFAGAASKWHAERSKDRGARAEAWGKLASSAATKVEAKLMWVGLFFITLLLWLCIIFLVFQYSGN